MSAYKKKSSYFMHTPNGNSGRVENMCLCSLGRTKTYVSTIVLLFIMMQLSGQTDIKYGAAGIMNYCSGNSQIETALLPAHLYEQAKLRNTGSEKKTAQQVQAVSVAMSSNNSPATGATTGIPDVTATGGASYRIPIEVPAGVAGTEPSVSIVYNSQSGYGSAGYGWNPAASSVITRCGKTYYYDNAAEAPQLSNADNLMLDGQRLIPVSGINLTAGATYRMEYDPFTDIVFKTTGSFNGFVVRTKDGNSREYGSTANSNIETSDGSTLLWLLSEVTDKNGNTITYEYEEIIGNGEFYPKKIQYAGNRTIRFTYETRDDIQRTYFAGTACNTTKRLKSISTHIGQTPIRQYEFNYVFDGLYSKLTEIIEKGQNGEYYNPTRIDYSDHDTFEQGDEYLAPLSVNRQGNMPLFADFNGDGKTDFLSFPEKTSYTSSDSATVYLATLVYGDVHFNKRCAIPMQISGAVFNNFLLADLNGDGKTDVVNVSRASNGTYRYNYYLFDGEKLTYNYTGFNTNGYEALTGDFNGDGKEEILVKDNCEVFNDLGTKIASGGIADWGSEYIKEYFPNNRYLCDFNGNGKMDILVLNESSAWVYELNGSCFVRLTSFNTTDINNGRFPHFGDFNGDGLTDVLIYRLPLQGSAYDVNILFSTGKGFVKQAIRNVDIKAKVFTGDFNGDGKSDIFHMENANGVIRMNVGIFNGADFTTTTYSTDFLNSSTFDVPYQYDKFLFQVADFNGDGRSEFCCARYVDCYIIRSFQNSQNLLARDIVNGLGVHTSFEYMPITDGGYCSNTGNTVSFPLSGRLYPMYVVTGMTQSAGNCFDHIYYRYKNPRIHRQGKGFLGFEEIESIDYNRDRKTMTQYGYDTGYYYPYITRQKVTTSSGTDVSLSVYENAFVNNGLKRLTPYIRKQTNTDYLTNTVTTVECKEIDDFGSPKKIETKYGNDVTETVTYDYFSSGTDNLWIYGLPLTVEKKTERGTESWTEKQIITYNGNCLPETVNIFTNDGTKKVSAKTFLYDVFGNVTAQSSKTFSSTNALTTGYEYSADGVYLTKVTDPLSSVTVTNYNASGRILSVTDSRNNTTTYEYDGMGRFVGANYPDGTSSSVTLAQGGAPANSAYHVIKQTTGKPAVKIYFDAFNRELRSSEIRYDGSEMHRDKIYDNAGRLQKESLPFKGSSASLWNMYSYDSFGRLTSEVVDSGKTTSYSYSDRNVTVTDNGIASTRCYDAQGNLTSVSDPAGTIVYNLRPDGQPSSVVAPGNVTTSFLYDIYGRQETIVDPSAGTRSLEYDAAGNINRETDANGHVKSMSYDVYNRLVSKILPEFTTSYAYDADGRLLSETSGNGTSCIYRYDTYGRLDTVINNGTDGKWMEKTYSYSDGNVSSIQYASQSGSIGTESMTYTNGHLSEIKTGSTSIWKLNGENNFGQPTAVATGTVSRTYSYNACGIPTGRTAASANAIFQTHTYNFDAAKGNLTYRKDNERNIQENFLYDNLNRLTNFAEKSVSYDIKGNITQKSDAGASFLYDTPGKPYAISGINTVAIPMRTQTVAYTSFERPASITENGYTATFTYTAAGDRVKMRLTNDISNVLTRHYLGGIYEMDTMPSGTKERLYLGGDAYSAPAVYIKENTGSWNIYYICRDYQGSITHITDSSGLVEQELSYDAWGRLRNPVNLDVYASDAEPALFLGRGYTGHEHLPEFGLINMNARLYDPAIGRFLSPDPFVQAPDFSQSFNRYSYCLNNPLIYTDPDGEFVWFVPIIIGAIIGGVANLGIKAHQGKINSWGDGFAAFGIGAAAGAIGAATGGAAFAAAGGAAAGAGGFLAGAAGGAVGTAFSSPVLSMGNSAYFGDPMMTGKQYLMSIAGGALLGGTVNGITALANGRNFLNGNLSSSNAPIAPTVTQPAQNTGTLQGQAQAQKALPEHIEYPPNNGAIGTPETKYLYQGEIVDRFGGTTESSRFLSPEGTPIPSRSLPPSTNLKLHDIYQVAKPFPVQSSTISPWFGQPGLGTQYVTPRPIQLLLNRGILIRYTITLP